MDPLPDTVVFLRVRVMVTGNMKLAKVRARGKATIAVTTPAKALFSLVSATAGVSIGEALSCT
jgi:hypothetical protein